MTASRKTWTIFALCAAAMLGVMAWMTGQMLQLEEAEHRASLEAARQERIRLALWRMDSLLAPRLAEEAARPEYHYEVRYANGKEIVQSPLTAIKDPIFKLYFQINPNGSITSPQVADAGRKESAAENNKLKKSLEVLKDIKPEAELQQVEKFRDQKEKSDFQFSERQQATPQQAPQELQQIDQPGAEAQQQQRLNSNEFLNRVRNARLAQSQAAQRSSIVSSNFQGTKGMSQQMPPGVKVGAFTPVWMKDGKGRLLLVFFRKVSAGEQTRTQGIVADWPKIRTLLLQEIGDLLPAAQLRPVPDADYAAADKSMLLANIPVVLEPGHSYRQEAMPLLTPVRGILAFSWLAVLGALATSGYVLREAVDLSRRRGEFVSAVTHELRTPLTTFKMYCEMLAEGMVREEADKQQYLVTLQDESDHLSRLVENVLTYARVEQGRKMISRHDRLAVESLVEQATARAVNRAERAGIAIDVSISDAATDNEILTDVSAVEQILTNLIDNATKYACVKNPHIELTVDRLDGELCIRICDNGPGIAAKDAELIFEAFRRGTTSDGVRQGVGLGLAISRRLARELGGELRLAQNPSCPGAEFILVLPITDNV